ncbi:MAG: hypothetical protein VW907_08835 [Opitutae bacterium]
MASISDYVLDAALSKLDTEANRVDICSSEPTTYTAATSTNTLGNSTSISISAPTDGDTSGRKVTLSAISGASVTGTGTAAYFAITDTTNSRLLATGALSGGGQSVTSGNTFSLTAVDIEIPDPS